MKMTKDAMESSIFARTSMWILNKVQERLFSHLKLTQYVSYMVCQIYNQA